jgi:hypothetical protein
MVSTSFEQLFWIGESKPTRRTKMHPKVRRVVNLTGLCLLLCIGVSTVQAQKRITIQANAKGTSTQMGRIIPVRIIIESTSTPEDQKLLIEGFKKNRTDGMRSALEKMKPKGRISPERSVGNDVKYIRQLPAENGQRRFRLVTDRNLAFAELYGGTRSKDYSIGAIELVITADGKDGSGTVLPACLLTVNKKTNEIEIETYQNPWKLENFIVHIEE